MKPVLFISHSSGDATPENPRANALQAALAATGCCETVFDVQDLQQGRDYRPQLFRWMARCHAGVLLITPQVMQRPDWVLQEATVLRARSELEGARFKLFMLIDEAVLKDPAWKHFAPLELDALQHVRLASPTDPIDGFVAKVAQGMAELAGQAADPLGRLATLIFDRLEPFVAERAARDALNAYLQVERGAWREIVLGPDALCAFMARRMAGGDLADFGGLNALFNRLQDKARSEDRTQLLAVLQSHWVPLANAARLAEALAGLPAPAPATAGSAPANLLLLHTEAGGAELVARLHQERQFRPIDALGDWVSMELGNETAAAFEARLRDALQRRLYPGDPAITLDDIALDLADDLAAHIYCFVHVGGVETLQHLLPAARRLPSALFVLTAREPTSARLAAELPLPPIDPPHPQEAQRLRDLGKARQRLLPAPPPGG